MVVGVSACILAIVGIWLFNFIIRIGLCNKKDLFVLFWGLVFFVYFLWV